MLNRGNHLAVLKVKLEKKTPKLKIMIFISYFPFVIIIVLITGTFKELPPLRMSSFYWIPVAV